MGPCCKIFFQLLFLVFSTIIARAQAPLIASFSPSSGPIGTTVTINGANFSTTAANNFVFFGAVRATVSAASSTTLTVTVPAGATYQPITVTVNQLTGYSDKPFSATFNAGSGFATVPLIPQNFAASPLPYDVATADIDGDGKPDIISSNSGGNTISVFRNITFNDTIKLSPRIDFATGANPKNISIADYNGDGKPDIAVVNFDASSISILKNNSSIGSISFEPKADFATGVNPSMLNSGDIDGDGKTDIVVSNKSSNTISVLRNITSANLSFSKTDIATGSEPTCVRIADMNGDKKPDVIVSNYSSNTISVFGNNSSAGSLSLTIPTQFSSGALHPYWITIADLDGDNKNDIITSLDSLPLAMENQHSPVKIFRNNGTGSSFSFSLVDGFPYHIASVRTTVGDMNGDGKPDIALPFSYDYWSVFVKNESTSGNISFSQNFEEYLYATVGSFPNSIAMGDLNADGKPDAIIAAGEGSNQDLISVQKNNFWQGPDISHFEPYTATVGDTIMIYGSNFENTTSVSFGGIPAASFNVISPTRIRAVVDRGASGHVTVTTAFGSSRYIDDYSFDFTYTEPQPSITSINPAEGAPGDTIHIYGTHFIDINSVTFGGVAAQSFIVYDKTHIAAVLSSGASGYLKVANSFKADSVAGFTFYTIRPPVITSFFPTSVTVGDTITIKGRNLTGASYVRLGGTIANFFTVVSDSVIKAVAGPYNNMDNVYIITPGGSTFLSGYTFYTHPPVFNSYWPNAGDSGTVVILKGMFLSEVLQVYFGSKIAQSFKIINDTTIEAIIGAGTSGSISIENVTATVSLPGFIFIPTVPPPIITSFAPPSGNTGSTVVINGLNFSSNVADNAVFFGAVKAGITSTSATSLTVTVPPGASYGPVSVTILPNKLTGFSNSFFNPVFANSDTGTVFNFKQEKDLTGLNDPRKSAIADFDGDGKADIAVTNYTAGVVSVFRNATSNITVAFNNKIDFTIYNSPLGVTASDINGDGKIDLIISHFSSLIGVLVNTGSPGIISFAPEVLLSNNRTLQFRNTVVRDWDGNGKPDIATCDYIINDNLPISIFRNTGSAGNIAFAIPQHFAAGLSGSLDAIVANDIDGDGKQDLALTSRYDKAVTIMQNKGTSNNISFTPAGNYPVGFQPGGLALGDVDGDGKPDIVVTLTGYNVFSVFRNTSSPGVISFAPRVDFNTGFYLEDILLSDLDGDNKLDVALTKRNSPSVNSISVYKNKSTAGVPVFEFKNSFNTGISPLHINAGDLNGDGRPEIITVNSAGNSISVFRNKIGEPPVINSITPLSAGEAATVTIKGENFYNINSVYFGNIPAASFILESDSVITAIVGSGGGGSVNVVSAAGNAQFPGFIYLSPKYVTQNGAGLKNGSSWTNAWGAAEFANNLYNQPAGTPIWIAKGIYKPTRDENGVANINSSLLTFSVPAGVRLYGGFAGNETSINGRLLQSVHGINTTRLSGDIGTLNLQDDNCAVTVTLKNCTQNETLDGITISNATGNGIKMSFNANVLSAPLISNCIIADNSPSDAGLLITGNGSSSVAPIIQNSIFSNNHSALYGAALITGNCRPVFENCVFYNNGKTAAGTGASAITFSAAAGSILNCDFIENSLNHTTANGAAVVLNNSTDSIYINNTIFWNNYNEGNINNLLVAAGNNTVSVKNCLFQNQTDGNAPVVLLNIVTANPDFINIADADGIDDVWATSDDGLLVQPFSSVIDKGNNSLTRTFNTSDLILNQRVYNGTVDIGAYEIQSGLMKLCPGSNALIRSDIAGSRYQWQVNVGTGFTNLGNNLFYAGTNSNELQLINAPQAWNGYKYRCFVNDSNYSREYILQFTDTWTGAVSNVWENAANWSCASVPNATTEVLISKGTAIVNSTVTVKSISVLPGASVTINTGNVLLSGGGIASGSLAGSPGACSSIATAGLYKQGVALTPSNTIQVQVNVSVAGAYYISTNTVNTISFAGSGSFAGTGLQTVTLTGAGTPEFRGNYSFVLQFGTSTCSFTINFAAATPDYFPIVTNSTWSYKVSGVSTPVSDSVFKQCLPNYIDYNGKQYRSFLEVSEMNYGNNIGYRKSGNDYYGYYNKFSGTYSLLYIDQTGEIKLFNDNLPVGGTWTSNIRAWVNGGSPNTNVQVQGSILERDVSVTLSTGLNFSNVIKTRLLFFDMTIPSMPNLVYYEERWYALGVGLIYFKSGDPFGVGITYELKRYQVN